ncbi:MAG: hypothetical protein M5R40_13815 [Anaerolineae bacterium]|nr:hypothetical protein [Anaerolineae bacterium]
MSQHLISLALILSLLSGPVIPSALAQEAEVWTEVLRIGRGGVTDIAWSPTGEVIAVATELGTWLYTPELETIRFLEGGL